MPLREAGAAMVVADGALDTPVFGDEVMDLLRDADRRARMAHAAGHLGRPRAAESIAETALEAAKAHSPWRSRMPKNLRSLSSVAPAPPAAATATAASVEAPPPVESEPEPQLVVAPGAGPEVETESAPGMDPVPVPVSEPVPVPVRVSEPESAPVADGVAESASETHRAPGVVSGFGTAPEAIVEASPAGSDVVLPGSGDAGAAAATDAPMSAESSA